MLACVTARTVARGGRLEIVGRSCSFARESRVRGWREGVTAVFMTGLSSLTRRYNCYPLPYRTGVGHLRPPVRRRWILSKKSDSQRSRPEWHWRRLRGLSWRALWRRRPAWRRTPEPRTEPDPVKGTLPRAPSICPKRTRPRKPARYQSNRLGLKSLHPVTRRKRRPVRERVRSRVGQDGCRPSEPGCRNKGHH